MDVQPWRDLCSLATEWHLYHITKMNWLAFFWGNGLLTSQGVWLRHEFLEFIAWVPITCHLLKLLPNGKQYVHLQILVNNTEDFKIFLRIQLGTEAGALIMFSPMASCLPPQFLQRQHNALMLWDESTWHGWWLSELRSVCHVDAFRQVCGSQSVRHHLRNEHVFWHFLSLFSVLVAQFS